MHVFLLIPRPLFLVTTLKFLLPVGQELLKIEIVALNNYV
jgi:hypothetical protein